MEITKRKREDITILEPKGKMTIGKGDIALRESIQQVLDDGARKILINLDGTKKMDSSGLGELLAALTTVTELGGQLRLMNLPSKVQDLLGSTQLIAVYDIYDDEDEAVASFS